MAPVDGATGVERDATITATFTEDMFASTIDDTSFTLTGGSDVDGTVSFDATTNVASFTASADLAVLTSYTASLSDSITDLSGNALAATSWSFTTADGTWGVPELIETDDVGDARLPKVAFDGNGDAWAVWQQTDGTRYNIWANRYTAGTGWGAAELIESNDAGFAFDVQIAIDENGNALAIWYQSNGTYEYIWANYYTAGTGWGTAVQIDDNSNSFAYEPRVAFDANGNAIAVWTQATGSVLNVWSNTYTAGTGWGTAELLETGSAHGAAPEIAIDASGNAIAVWQQTDGTRYSIWANRYSAGTGWGTAELIETDDTGQAYSPAVIFDSSGDAIAIWQQQDGTRYNIHSNTYSAGSGWSTPVLVENDNAGHAQSPEIAIDANDNVLAAWLQNDGTRYNVWASRYTAASGWGSAVLLETENSGSAEAIQLAFDENGNALAVWQINDGSKNDAWTNRYTAASGWETAARLTTSNTSDADYPDVAVDADGNGLAVWQEFDGARFNIWAKHFE